MATAGCTTQSELRHAELLDMAGLMPGVYDNRLQAEQEALDGRVVHPAELLEVQRVSVPVLGRLVLHVREHSAGDLRRVLSDRLWVFDSESGKQLVAQVNRFKEPAHWAGEGSDPELLRSLMPQDVTSLPGCTLVVVRAPGGFRADAGAAGCPASDATGAARLVQHWQFADGHLELAELPPGQVPATADWYRFVKLASGEAP
ncbi:MAG: CpeT/CpcT family [Pseudomonadota bacterium]